MLDAIDELFVAALERETKTDQLCALRNIDKSAGADDAAAEPTHVHVAVAIYLAGAHERRVQSPAVIEIKLTGMWNDRRGVRCDAEVHAAGRYAAVDTGFDSECNRV